MDTSGELGGFLRSRRAHLQPDDVGLVSHGARRVPGLRREELAQLAGVSVTYYTRLEQGQSLNASDAVLEAVSRALRLTPDERAHLLDIARPSRKKRRPASRPATARLGTRQLIGALESVPAVVMDSRSDVLAWNRLGHSLLAGHHDPESPYSPADRPNLTRMLFLDEHTRELYTDWAGEARRSVASLRLVAGRHPHDRRLAELIGELSVRSKEFSALWAGHSVTSCTFGTKCFHHPTVGPLELSFEVLVAPDDAGHRTILYSAAPGSPAEAALRLLAVAPASATDRRSAPLPR
jgi:transcriptional regulator with XRE-family HTH domain